MINNRYSNKSINKNYYGTLRLDTHYDVDNNCSILDECIFYLEALNLPNNNVVHKVYDTRRNIKTLGFQRVISGFIIRYETEGELIQFDY